MAEFLLDANILIGVFRGESDLKTFVERLDATIDTTVYVELVQGAKDNRDVERIEAALRRFEMVPFDESISRRTIALIRTYSKSHGLMFGDAVIAATCLEKNLELLTFNLKHCRFIEELKMSAPKL